MGLANGFCETTNGDFSSLFLKDRFTRKYISDVVVPLRVVDIILCISAVRLVIVGALRF